MVIMDLGSWFTQSSLSIYGGHHVIYNICPKNIVETSTHMCFGVTPKCGQVTPPHHTSPFLTLDKECFLHRFCCSMLMPAVTSDTLYPHTSYS
jgi:hypothetical protein